MNHVLYKDNFYIRHFIEWLDSSISDTEEWLKVERTAKIVITTR